jgi:hypothetical protein
MNVYKRLISVWLPLMGPTPPPWSVLQRPRPMNLFLCGNEGVQMHGGIDMTDGHEIGFFVKRRRVAQAGFGNTAFCRDRYARLISL